MYCKIHFNQGKEVFACCEKELIGKKLDAKTDFEVSEYFYKEKKINEQELRELLKEQENINLVGEKPVKIALEQGLIAEKNIIKVGKFKHAIIIKV